MDRAALLLLAQIADAVIGDPDVPGGVGGAQAPIRWCAGVSVHSL